MYNNPPDFSSDEALSENLQADFENVFEWYEQQHNIPKARLLGIARDLLGA